MAFILPVPKGMKSEQQGPGCGVTKTVYEMIEICPAV